MTKRIRLPNPYGLRAIYAPVSFDEGVALARRALVSQKPPEDMNLHDQIFELMCNLCQLAEDANDGVDFLELDILLEEVLHWHYSRSSDRPDDIDVRVTVRDVGARRAKARSNRATSKARRARDAVPRVSNHKPGIQ